jgi:hypothetical protein
MEGKLARSADALHPSTVRSTVRYHRTGILPVTLIAVQFQEGGLARRARKPKTYARSRTSCLC